MVFSSLFFLYIFLPLCLLLYFIQRSLTAKNIVLLCASLVFYAWGEPVYVLLMLAVAALNWGFSLAFEKKRSRALLALCVALNLLGLIVFKYAGFLVENCNAIFKTAFAVPQISLPIGISFYTFQALSYSVDVYRKDVAAQRSYWKLLLYVSMFPQLIAGPIVRYVDVAAQIDARELDSENIFRGVTRFCIGLGKKVLLADHIGQVADQLLGGSFAGATSVGILLGMLAYMFQIYFDFSGYSDMAIGLGKILGFTFMENFRLPYTAKSITEFWRRWHISLSSFFRDYVYIPLGGSRCSRARQVLNLFAVWSLTGIWHGANWTFLAWGLWFFVLLTAEKLWLGKALSRLPRVFGHVYALLAVLIGWIFFNSRSLPDALGFLRALAVPGTGAPDGGAWLLLCLKQYGLQLAVCFVLCTDLGKKLWQTLGGARAGRALRYAVLALVFFLSVLTLTGSGMQAFIYARF